MNVPTPDSPVTPVNIRKYTNHVSHLSKRVKQCIYPDDDNYHHLYDSPSSMSYEDEEDKTRPNQNQMRDGCAPVYYQHELSIQFCHCGRNRNTYLFPNSVDVKKIQPPTLYSSYCSSCIENDIGIPCNSQTHLDRIFAGRILSYAAKQVKWRKNLSNAIFWQPHECSFCWPLCNCPFYMEKPNYENIQFTSTMGMYDETRYFPTALFIQKVGSEFVENAIVLLTLYFFTAAKRQTLLEFEIFLLNLSYKLNGKRTPLLYQCILTGIFLANSQDNASQTKLLDAFIKQELEDDGSVQFSGEFDRKNFGQEILKDVQLALNVVIHNPPCDCSMDLAFTPSALGAKTRWYEDTLREIRHITVEIPRHWILKNVKPIQRKIIRVCMQTTKGRSTLFTIPLYGFNGYTGMLMPSLEPRGTSNCWKYVTMVDYLLNEIFDGLDKDGNPLGQYSPILISLREFLRMYMSRALKMKCRFAGFVPIDNDSIVLPFTWKTSLPRLHRLAVAAVKNVHDHKVKTQLHLFMVLAVLCSHASLSDPIIQFDLHSWLCDGVIQINTDKRMDYVSGMQHVYGESVDKCACCDYKDGGIPIFDIVVDGEMSARAQPPHEGVSSLKPGTTLARYQKAYMARKQKGCEKPKSNFPVVELMDTQGPMTQLDLLGKIVPIHSNYFHCQSDFQHFVDFIVVCTRDAVDEL